MWRMKSWLLCLPEWNLNSRPLTYQSSEPRDDVPLPPNHFLHSQMGGQFAPESVHTTTFHPRQRWRKFRTLFHEFGEDGLRNVFLHLTGDQSGLQKSKPLYKHIRVLLCKKQLIFEKWEYFENGQKWPQCKTYSPCKILSLGKKKLLKLCEKALYKHFRVVLCK